jgi:hypothetical protein
MGDVRCRDGGNWDGLDRLAQRSPSLSHGLLDPQFWTKKSSNIDTRSIIVVERGGGHIMSPPSFFAQVSSLRGSVENFITRIFCCCQCNALGEGASMQESVRAKVQRLTWPVNKFH